MAWVEEMSEQDQSKTDVLRASPPMFDSRLLDFFSRVHPVVPVLIFAPAIVVLEAWGLSKQGLGAALGLTVAGYVIWTLFEYWLHRLGFHFAPEEGLGARLARIIPGVPPRPPPDPLPLVMPPPGGRARDARRVAPL